MGVKANFVLSIPVLVIVGIGFALAVQLFLPQPAPLSEEKVSALVEEKTKICVVKEKVKEIIKGAVVALKPAVPGKGKK